MAQRLPDLMMSGIDGFEVARRLRANSRTCAIPVIIVTAMDDRASRIRGLEAGAEEFLCKPVESAELLLRVKNMLRIKSLSDSLADHDRLMEEQVITRTHQLTDSNRDTIFTLARAAEYHDEETGMHIKRVSYYSKALAEQMGMDETFCDAIFYASPLHDVGKVGVSAEILRKPSKLKAE